MGGRDVDFQLRHEAGEPRGLAFRQIEDEPRQRGGVDDRVLERAFEPTADEPCVEGVVAVLDQHGPLGKAKEAASRVLELWGADQHRAIDVVAPARVRVDGRAAVDQGVEERQRLVQSKSLGAYLEDEERRVAGRLHVEGDELRLVERSVAAHLRGVDRDLLPRNRLGGTARLQEERPAFAQVLAAASARRAQAIS